MAEQLCLLAKGVRAPAAVGGMMDGLVGEDLGETVVPQGQGPMDGRARRGWRGNQARNRLGKYRHEKPSNEQLKPSPKPSNPELPGDRAPAGGSEPDASLLLE